MSTSISSLSIRTTVPSTTSPCLKLLMSESCSVRSSSIVVGSGPSSFTGLLLLVLAGGGRVGHVLIAQRVGGGSDGCVGDGRGSVGRRGRWRWFGASAPSGLAVWVTASTDAGGDGTENTLSRATDSTGASVSTGGLRRRSSLGIAR